METKPIFDFLKEVRMPSIKTPCSAEEIEQYERDVLLGLLYDMKACLTDCLMKSSAIDVEAIKDDLRRSKAAWEEKPETSISGLMMIYIEDAERFVSKDFYYPFNDNAVIKTADQISRKERVEEKSVLTTKEVAERFGLPLNNVKDKQWRDRNGFPYRQFSRGGKVVFYTDEIEEWLECRNAS